MQVDVDQKAGFCWGVQRAITQAEGELKQNEQLYCLGQIVHNEEEESRLKAMGLTVIDHQQMKSLNNVRVLIRAHGEPPKTYQIAKENNIELIDATCPVVLKLQEKIKNSYGKGQIVIYGKSDHPEVVGLTGQVNDDVILVESPEDIHKIDFSKSVQLFAQTTKSGAVYHEIIQGIQQGMNNTNSTSEKELNTNKSICNHVSGRDSHLKQFARDHDLILFVGGEQSSNGKYLFGLCKEVNPSSFYLGGPGMLKPEWLEGKENIGVSGATSSPEWLLQKVAQRVKNLVLNSEE